MHSDAQGIAKANEGNSCFYLVGEERHPKGKELSMEEAERRVWQGCHLSQVQTASFEGRD